MYSVTPFLHKHKYYYDNDDIQYNLLLDLQKLYDSNATIEDIQQQITTLEKINNIYINNTSEYNLILNLLKSNLQRIINLQKLLPGTNFNVDKPFNTAIITSLNMKYVLYIEKYGVPDDGVFLEELLAEF
jgi:hypothetical protein